MTPAEARLTADLAATRAALAQERDHVAELTGRLNDARIEVARLKRLIDAKRVAPPRGRHHRTESRG